MRSTKALSALLFLTLAAALVPTNAALGQVRGDVDVRGDIRLDPRIFRGDRDDDDGRRMGPRHRPPFDHRFDHRWHPDWRWRAHRQHVPWWWWQTGFPQPIPQPLPPPVPTPIPPYFPFEDRRVITLADNNTTVFVRSGTTVVLRLGGNLEWQVRPTNPSVLPQIAGGFSAHTQAVYRAQFPGSATIVARGEPFCPPGEPCLPYIQPFHVNVIVR